MKELPAIESQDHITDPTTKAEEIPKKPILIEHLINDRELLSSVYDSLRADGPESYTKIISFGAEYQTTTKSTLLYYIKYYLGLTSWTNDEVLNNQLLEYLRLKLNQPEDCDKFLDSLYLQYDQTQEGVAKLRDKGFDLSSIIEKAPTVVMQRLDKNLYAVAPKFSGRDTSKVEDVYDYCKTSAEVISAFKGRTVIDLGAGSWGEGLRMVDKFGAKNYVGVENSNAQKLLGNVSDYFDTLKSVEKVHIVYDDMKTFLEFVPKGTDNVTMLISGIDQYMIGTSNVVEDGDVVDAGKRYYKEICTELKRALGEGGLIVVYASSFSFSEEDGFERIAQISCFESPINIYRKTGDQK